MKTQEEKINVQEEKFKEQEAIVKEQTTMISKQTKTINAHESAIAILTKKINDIPGLSSTIATQVSQVMQGVLLLIFN